jgi:hypothetical protein
MYVALYMCASVRLSRAGVLALRQVYSWGDGSCGRLGNASEQDSLVPLRVDTFAPNSMMDIAKVRAWHGMA